MDSCVKEKLSLIYVSWSSCGRLLAILQLISYQASRKCHVLNTVLLCTNPAPSALGNFYNMHINKETLFCYIYLGMLYFISFVAYNATSDWLTSRTTVLPVEAGWIHNVTSQCSSCLQVHLYIIAQNNVLLN